MILVIMVRAQHCTGTGEVETDSFGGAFNSLGSRERPRPAHRDSAGPMRSGRARPARCQSAAMSHAARDVRLPPANGLERGAAPASRSPRKRWRAASIEGAINVLETVA